MAFQNVKFIGQNRVDSAHWGWLLRWVQHVSKNHDWVITDLDVCSAGELNVHCVALVNGEQVASAWLLDEDGSTRIC